MKGTSFAFATASLVLMATEANATSWGRFPPHEPSKACKAIEAAVSEMTGKKLPMDFFPFYYSDEFGYVDRKEEIAFIHSMTSADGKPDQAPIEIETVWPVGKREAKDGEARYVVGLRRHSWHVERENFFDPMHTDPAGYEVVTSHWLVSFLGNEIREFREGPFFRFVDYDERLKGCGRG